MHGDFGPVWGMKLKLKKSFYACTRGQWKQDEEGDIPARVVELPGCLAHGETVAEALARLDETMHLWIEDSIERGDPIPQPLPDEEALPSGKWMQRVPRTLHAKITALARREGVSLNQMVSTILAQAVGESIRPVRSESEAHTAWTLAEPCLIPRVFPLRLCW